MRPDDDAVIETLCPIGLSKCVCVLSPYQYHVHSSLFLSFSSLSNESALRASSFFFLSLSLSAFNLGEGGDRRERALAHAFHHHVISATLCVCVLVVERALR